MMATGGQLGRWLIAICGVALLLTGTGCAVFIEAFGASKPDNLAAGSTRQEIRKLLGKPKASEARDGGIRVETYRIWEKKGYPHIGKSPAWSAQVGTLFDLIGFTLEATIMPESYELALVYGPDDHLLYFYVVNDLPEARFETARFPLSSLWTQLENDECPSWSACLTSYIDELRKRAAFVGYTLLPEEEREFQRLLEIARDVDEGRITKGEGRIGVAGHPHARGSFLDYRLTEALWRELAAGRCPSWVKCVTYYEQEVRMRAMPGGYALSFEDEKEFTRLLAIAASVDEGRVTTTEGQTEISWLWFRHKARWKAHSEVDARSNQVFDAIRRPLAQDLWDHLENDTCTSWVTCVTFYVQELRKGMTKVGYQLNPEVEKDFQQLLSIAKAADEGSMTKEKALTEIRMCSSALAQWYCARQ